MKLEEIAHALGVRTLAEVAASAGVDEALIRAAPLPRPTLVLDYRGLGNAHRWEKYAKPPLPELRGKLDLDPWTGLRRAKKRARKKS